MVLLQSIPQSNPGITQLLVVIVQCMTKRNGTSIPRLPWLLVNLAQRMLFLRRGALEQVPPHSTCGAEGEVAQRAVPPALGLLDQAGIIAKPVVGILGRRERGDRVVGVAEEVR